MDKDTRSAIERATQKARKLLEEDFAAQLEGDFDVHRDGEVAAKAGEHLSARDAYRRERILAAIEHKRAAEMSAADAARDYLRDAAFTTLNRFVALKMLEARELVQECITKGEQSGGYREFCGMAPGLPLLPESAGYRLYLESLFDELSTEVKVLFDRRDPSSVLWPKRTTFEQLLEILNASELSRVWGEDETIGWVYQFFNGRDERKKMREESQAPRNSRELAVRNQFFTPRYVVQFLTENTVGRIWYEMRRGETSLAQKCEYMVRQPNELWRSEDPGREPWVEEAIKGTWSAIPEDFDWSQSAVFAHVLNGYELAPALGLGDAGDLANGRVEAAERTGTWEGSALELWICLFFEHRRYRHFGFDPEATKLPLLNALCQRLRSVLIEEAAADNAPRFVFPRAKKDPRDLRVLDPACGSGHFLLYAFDLLLAIYEEAYVDPESPKSEATGKKLAEDYPSLDVLKRAVPGLILAHNLHGVDIDPRCAQIAQLALWMRAQKAYRDSGIGRAERPQIRRSHIVVAEPLVADEQIANEFVAKLGDAELGRVFTSLVESLSLAGDLGLLLRVEQIVARQAKRGQTGDLFAPPEERIRAALDRFVREEASTTRRLFAEDAAHGLALLGIAEKKFDAVLMNPPFGYVPDAAGRYIADRYSDEKNDVYAAFVARCVELTTRDGLVGQLTSSTCFSLSHLARFREKRLLGDSQLRLVADLGFGVLDDAAVATAAYVVSQAGSARCAVIDLRRSEEKGLSLKSASSDPTRWRSLSLDVFRALPGKPIAYTLLPRAAELLASGATVEGSGVDVNVGMMTGDDFRYLRTWWECPLEGATEWREYEKGNGFARFLSDPVVRVRATNEFAEAAADIALKYGSASRFIMNRARYGQAGLVYTRITVKGFSVRFLLPGQVFSGAGLAMFPKEAAFAAPLCAYLNSRVVEHALTALTDGRKWEAGYVRNAPVPGEVLRDEELADLAHAGAEHTLRRLALDETTRFFAGMPTPRDAEAQFCDASAAVREVLVRIDHAGLRHSCVTPEEETAVEAEVESQTNWLEREDSLLTELGWEAREMSYLLGSALGRWRDHVEPGVRVSLPDLLRGGLPSQPPAAILVPYVGRGVLVDDPGHADDVAVLMASLAVAGGRRVDESECRDWLRADAFAQHLSLYSACRRRAPIFWQLSTPSASYSVWLYIHAFSKDTLFRVQNDYLDGERGKLAHEERRVESLASELRDGATAAQRKTLAAQEAVVNELRAFLDEVKRVAPLWNPNLDDGVVINFAPLWRLVPQNKAWQKELKSTWDALADGKYDWAHLAMHLWPERVVPRCAKDRSLAIAHGLEAVFWVEGTDGKWTARKTPTKSVDELVKERTSPAVKSALKSLLEAPVASGKSTGRKGGGRRKAAAATEGGGG